MDGGILQLGAQLIGVVSRSRRGGGIFYFSVSLKSVGPVRGIGTVGASQGGGSGWSSLFFSFSRIICGRGVSRGV